MSIPKHINNQRWNNLVRSNWDLAERISSVIKCQCSDTDEDRHHQKKTDAESSDCHRDSPVFHVFTHIEALEKVENRR